MIKSFTFILLQLFCFWGFAQTINGNLSQLSNQEIKLEGFNGINTYPITQTTIDDKGNFKLQYAKSDIGVGYLISAENKPLFVILSGEDVELKGEALSYVENIKILKGQENIWFYQYAKENPKREQALSAWLFLEKMYAQDSLFSHQKNTMKTIVNERKRIKVEDATFLKELPKDTYVSWFLPTRKLVSNVSLVAQYHTEEIPETIAAFRAMDYASPRLYKSGLFTDAIESHFWLLENSGKSLDSVYVEMKLSIDAMMKHLVKDEQKLNEVTDYLFALLERQSLFEAAEYLALKALNEENCTLDTDLTTKLESYRTMKKGNTAPDILFSEATIAPAYQARSLPKKLSDLKNKYTLVVFGSSWCPKCTEEIPEIVQLYSKWKAQGVEVVFISLDDDKEAFKSFTANFPFLSTSDFKKWEGKTVKDYYVFSTPTMYLLDSKREIILRPNSVKQMDSWIDFYLIQNNK